MNREEQIIEWACTLSFITRFYFGKFINNNDYSLVILLLPRAIMRNNSLPRN